MLALTLAVVGVLFCAPAPALAQRPETLAAALENLDYDPLRRGPLLMIAPASVSYNDGGDASYEWPDGWRATAREIAPLFGRRFENINSVNVLVPEEMAVLNPEPMPVERYAQLGRSRAFYLLLGSLTAAQWRQIGSPQGLGMESLSAEQRPLFRAVLPDPFVVKSVVASGNGGYYSYSQKHYGEGGGAAVPPPDGGAGCAGTPARDAPRLLDARTGERPGNPDGIRRLHAPAPG